MYKKLAASALFCFILTIVPIQKAFSQENEKTVQTVIHLLDYISMDYPGAVQKGQIINESEYLEQVEFSIQAYDLVKKGKLLPHQEDEVLANLKELIQVIKDKKSADEVRDVANQAKAKIVILTGVRTAPKIWPDLKNGQALYQLNCMQCHGAKGDGQGELAKTLDPRPTNFLDNDLMTKVSPFHAFNSIELGVQGTSMRPFTELSKEDMWDLAFYVKSLRFEKSDTNQLRKIFPGILSQVNLENVAALNDLELKDTLKSKHFENPAIAVSALRLLSPKVKKSPNSLPVASEKLKLALQYYTEGNKTLARTEALNAYLEGIEPVESRLRAVNAKFVMNLEGQMLKVRQVIEKGEQVTIVEKEISQAQDMIADADKLLQGQKMSYWLTFVLAGSIMLREGLEAFLVLAVVLALIKKAGANKALPWLHGGWISAVALGVIGWFLSDYIIQFGGKNRELMEGLVSLFAVVILIWAGYWLHDKSYADKWTHFIKERIGGFLDKDKMFGLAAFSFMVVFREAFEVILFLQAINLEAAPENHSAIGLGVIAAVALIALFAVLFLKYSKRIPVNKLFLYSSWIIILLALILMGKGIHSLQESGWVSVNMLPSYMRVEWLGIYPSVQSIGAQVVLFLFVLMSYLYSKSKLKEVRA